MLGTTFSQLVPDQPFAAYEQLFKAAQVAPNHDPPNGPRHWRLPWPNQLRGHQRFWERYIDVRLSHLSSRKALKHLVPFRISLARVTADWLKPGSGYIQGFRYPHRAAVVVWIDAKSSQGNSIDQFIDQMVQIRSNGLYTVTWLEDRSKEQLGLKDLSTKALDRLLNVLKPGPVIQTDDDHPFSLATVVKGDFESADLKQEITTNEPIHRALYAMCTGKAPGILQDNDYQRRRIAKLGSDALPSDALYARFRSRAGWFPQQFGKPENKYPLGCYHNNLTFASLQTDSLLAAARLAHTRHLNNQPMGNLITIARSAAGMLGRLYGPQPKKIYQSYSVREQIEHERDMVNAVRLQLLSNASLLADS
jgi:hypothetical protein